MPPPRVAPAALFMFFIGVGPRDVFRRVGETQIRLDVRSVVWVVVHRMNREFPRPECVNASFLVKMGGCRSCQRWRPSFSF